MNAKFKMVWNNKKLIPLIMLLISPLCVAEEDLPTVIALFGDSITVGYNTTFNEVDIQDGSTTHGLPTIALNELLNEGLEKRSSIVTNWGDGGSSSENGLSRIERDLTENTSRHQGKSYYILILYGTNDRAYGISTSSTAFNIGEMIKKSRQLGYEPIIGTILPVVGRDVQPRNALIVGQANAESAFVVDHYTRYTSEPGGFASLLDPDGLHPTNDGYRVIAQTWFDQRLKHIIEPDPFDPVVIVPILGLLLDE